MFLRLERVVGVVLFMVVWVFLSCAIGMFFVLFSLSEREKQKIGFPFFLGRVLLYVNTRTRTSYRQRTFTSLPSLHCPVNLSFLSTNTSVIYDMILGGGMKNKSNDSFDSIINLDHAVSHLCRHRIWMEQP